MRTTKVKEEFEEMENLFEKRKGEGRWEKEEKNFYLLFVRGKEEEGVYFKKKKKKENKNKNKEKKKKSKRERAFG